MRVIESFNKFIIEGGNPNQFDIDTDELEKVPKKEVPAKGNESKTVVGGEKAEDFFRNFDPANQVSYLL